MYAMVKDIHILSAVALFVPLLTAVRVAWDNQCCKQQLLVCHTAFTELPVAACCVTCFGGHQGIQQVYCYGGIVSQSLFMPAVYYHVL